jgi:hypothetical protein
MDQLHRQQQQIDVGFVLQVAACVAAVVLCPPTVV